jgi:hypothetical protein
MVKVENSPKMISTAVIFKTAVLTVKANTKILSTIIRMKDHGLTTPRTARAFKRQNHPNIKESGKITKKMDKEYLSF